MTLATQTARETILESFAGTDVYKGALVGPDGMKTNLYGLFLEDGSHVRGTAVTAGYRQHTVDTVATLTEAAAMSFGENVQPAIKTFWNGAQHRVSIGPSNDYRRSIFGTNDNIFPRAIITAGYDGTAFVGEAGFYRDACENLMMARQVSGTRVAIRHTESMNDKIDALVAQFRQLAQSYEKTVDFASDLERRDASISEFVAALYPLPNDAPQVQVTKFRNRGRKIMQRLLRERHELGRQAPADRDSATLWELANAVTGYIQHDKTRQNGVGTVAARPFLAIADKDSDAVWKLAAQLAA